MDNKKSRTLSLTSTILLTIYTVFMVLAEVGLLAICQIMRELSAGGFDMATNSIAAGGNMAEYALPGSVFGSLFAGFGGLAWLVISSFVIFFIVICTVYIAVTAISYVLVKREYYKADAWMKIAVFGTTFLGFILGTSLSCLQMLCLTILLVLPIILSVRSYSLKQNANANVSASVNQKKNSLKQKKLHNRKKNQKKQKKKNNQH